MADVEDVLSQPSEYVLLIPRRGQGDDRVIIRSRKPAEGLMFDVQVEPSMLEIIRGALGKQRELQVLVPPPAVKTLRGIDWSKPTFKGPEGWQVPINGFRVSHHSGGCLVKASKSPEAGALDVLGGAIDDFVAEHALSCEWRAFLSQRLQALREGERYRE